MAIVSCASAHIPDLLYPGDGVLTAKGFSVVALPLGLMVALNFMVKGEL